MGQSRRACPQLVEGDGTTKARKCGVSLRKRIESREGRQRITFPNQPLQGLDADFQADFPIRVATRRASNGPSGSAHTVPHTSAGPSQRARAAYSMPLTEASAAREHRE